MRVRMYRVEDRFSVVRGAGGAWCMYAVAAQCLDSTRGNLESRAGTYPAARFFSTTPNDAKKVKV